MRANLTWVPDRYQPRGELVAKTGGITYRVSSWHPSMRSKGCRLAFAGAQPLGEFPCTVAGMAAARMACQVSADAHASAG